MRLRRSVLSCLLLTGLCLGALSPAQAADDPTPSATPTTAGASTAGADAATEALSVDATREEAQQALDQVQDLFAPMSRTEARSLVRTGEGRDATLALRDLAVRMSSLPRAARSSAYSDFQRPWADNDAAFKTYCEPRNVFCVHWLSKATHPTNADATDDAWVTTNVIPTLRRVTSAYRGAGYRAPRADGPRRDGLPMYGGTTAPDIYLMDVGRQGKYGYCTVDVDDSGRYVYRPTNARSSDLPAFCVLDNDFSKSDFPTARTPLQDLQVTAAHEYFHAVQFAYDYLEDRWFMEATATWAEEQVYDPINDNVQYLRRSQLRYPGTSLDTFDGAGGFLQYGDWIFFQYLSERLPTRVGGIPVIVRRMWQHADSVTGPDRYSIQAVAAALRERHVDLNRAFAKYAAANRHPSSAYAEGRANRYPVLHAKKTVTLKPSRRKTSATFKVNHLASATARFKPKGLGKRSTRLTLTVNMADKSVGSQAVVVVFYKSGRVGTKLVKLDKHGNGRTSASFSSRTVTAVDLVLVNAAHSYKSCWSGTAYSCSGTPRYNHVKERFTAKVR